MARKRPPERKQSWLMWRVRCVMSWAYCKRLGIKRSA